MKKDGRARPLSKDRAISNISYTILYGDNISSLNSVASAGIEATSVGWIIW